MIESEYTCTPRSRFEAALRNEMPDRVPAVAWDNKLPGGTTDPSHPIAKCFSELAALTSRAE